jgi:dipeptide/tripeptide permease
MTDSLGFAKEGVGIIKSTIQPLLYFLPIITGAIADKVGYRKTLMVAFAVMGIGYILTSQFDTYSAVFISLIILGIGAGTFKPVISGTIAKVTDARTSSLGFGIFYWTINLGAFIFPLVIVPVLKSVDSSLVMLTGGIATGALIIPTFLFMKDRIGDDEEVEKAPKEDFDKVIKDIFMKVVDVAKDWRFLLFIFIYSWFWILYFQMFDTVLWYVQMFVDTTPLDKFVSTILGFEWHFGVEHVTVINAGTIILLQLMISALVRNTKPLPTMITGISMGVIGMAVLAISQSIWVFMLGTFIFSIGEMTAHPKYISYLGMIAPKDKKATYMGFSFLYGVFGSFFGGIIGALLYVKFVDNPMIEFIKTKMVAVGGTPLAVDVKIKEALDAGLAAGMDKAEILSMAQTDTLWYIFCMIGVACIVGLLVYNKFLRISK